ncbi:endolytic transglycosylase MltG [Streptomyces corynorhini]|uniref:Endolytic transglycosylase MltG n=1 Tax=Streptomyces corynorhini TaxID=2282652 RepID=A0A370B735_9ACTN|nr:endolytic transglycosylase MltG [Streptomyces corynorhini]RDG35225.1 endolytic transglycosylase MltG [Streptomyces corynorhini]
MSRPRLTRRGRIALSASAVLVAVAAVLVPVLTLTGGDDEARRTALVVPEGRRAAQVYAAVDEALRLPGGTAAKAALTAELPLPKAARGNPEGYLFPATYPVEAATTPAGLLRYMVSTAHDRFGSGRGAAGSRPSRDLADAATYRKVVLASIVQAEADTPADMGKVARVVHNRLALGMPLQMDSTLNYALDRSTLDTSHRDTKTDSPFNTYRHKGLPPAPIGNPGEEAMRAVADPPAGDWLYFVTVKPGDTRFTHRYAEHRRNVEEFNRNRAGASAAR